MAATCQQDDWLQAPNIAMRTQQQGQPHCMLRVTRSYHEDVVSFPPRSVPGCNGRVTRFQDDVRSGIEGRVGKNGIVDHHFLV